MLVSAPYSQAYWGPIPNEKGTKERIESLYSVFTRGTKAVVQGFKNVSPYAKYAKQGLEESRRLAKLGYGYSLRGIRYSYEKRKDGLYYITIAKEHMIPVVSDAKDYTGNVANLQPSYLFLLRVDGLILLKR